MGAFEQHVALKQCFPMLGEHHVSDRKADEKPQPPAVGGSEAASTVEVKVAPLSQAANAYLYSPILLCIGDILGTKKKPYHQKLSFSISLQIGCQISCDYQHDESKKI